MTHFDIGASFMGLQRFGKVEIVGDHGFINIAIETLCGTLQHIFESNWSVGDLTRRRGD